MGWTLKPFNLMFSALLVLLLVSGSTAEYLHKGKDLLGGDQDIVLKGHSFTVAEDLFDTEEEAEIEESVDPGIRQVDFYVHIERSVIVWDELSQGGASIKCGKSLEGMESGAPLHQSRLLKTSSREQLPNGEYVFTIGGGGVTASDLPAKATLIFSTLEWETVCGAYLDAVDGIDESDDTLFLEIQETTESTSGSYIVRAKQISGSGVAPIVDVEVHHEKIHSGATSTGTFYEEGSVAVSTRIIHATDHFSSANYEKNVSLNSVSARPSFRYGKTVTLPGGVGRLSMYAGISAGVTRFRFSRWYRLQFTWEQYFYAYFSSSLTVLKVSNSNKGGALARAWIPGLTFSAGIPFIARIRAGALVGINWYLTMDVNVAATLKFNARYQRREAVTAQLLPPAYSARNILTNPSKFGRGTVSVAGSTANAKLSGSSGVRPWIGIGIEFKRRSWFKWKTYRIYGNVGANLGLDVYTQLKINPAHRPYTGSGLRIGTCDKCHALRGGAAVSGKRLSAQLISGTRIVKEHVFISTLFNIPLGTICVIPLRC